MAILVVFESRRFRKNSYWLTLGCWIIVHTRLIFFRANFPSAWSLLGTVQFFFLDQISSLYVYFALYDYLFWTFFRTFSIKLERNPLHRPLTNDSNECFEHSNSQKQILTFHDGQEEQKMFSGRKKKLAKLCIIYKEEFIHRGVWGGDE